MQYIKVTLAAAGEQSGILIALLAEAGYDGFEETEDELLAYIERPKFLEQELQAVASRLGATYAIELVEPQNWNELWESNFPPVIVEDFCTIRASFHDIDVTTPYDIRITPKMSFGTGHHATTQLMMLMMREQEFKGATVLDFGTGTGVLAILAEMLGAADILAIDNDNWCVENARENVITNNCRNIGVEKGSLEDIPFVKNDLILANINRHILLQYMPMLYERCKIGGCLIMSGLLVEDKDVITDAAVKSGFQFGQMKDKTGWIALIFNKV